jgi:hypothetical protein
MSDADPRELAHREQDGLEVTLLWDPRSNDVSVEVVDARDDTFVRIPVAGRFALDAFHHPYAYALRSESSADLVTQTAE